MGRPMRSSLMQVIFYHSNQCVVGLNTVCTRYNCEKISLIGRNEFICENHKKVSNHSTLLFTYSMYIKDQCFEKNTFVFLKVMTSTEQMTN